jgi:hypothetical protein
LLSDHRWSVVRGVAVGVFLAFTVFSTSLYVTYSLGGTTNAHTHSTVTSVTRSLNQTTTTSTTVFNFTSHITTSRITTTNSSATNATTGPVITSVTPITTDIAQIVVVQGMGFGVNPATVTNPDGSVDTLGCNVTTPSFAIHDNGQPGGSTADHWAAGRDNCTNTDDIGLDLVNWTNDEIVLKGFGSALTNSSDPGVWQISLGDALQVLVFGPDNDGQAAFNLTAVAPDSTPAIGSWSNVTSSVTGSPGNRSSSSEDFMVYDAADGYDLLFGGLACVGSCYLGDTWIFSNNHWTNVTKAPSPSPRAGEALVYDAADGYVLLFGGFNGTTFFNDTWIFSHGAWTELHPAVAPPARSDTGVAYDAADGYVVLFGGRASTAPPYYNDTWTFRAGTWTELHPSIAPSYRTAEGMTYDYADKYVVMFGGTDDERSSAAGLDDTWKFLGGVWTQLFPSTGPTDRYQFSMVFDNATGYVLLYGGWQPFGSCGANQEDTWEFLGGNFQLLASNSSVGPLYGYALSYDPKVDTVLLFGGTLQTGSGGYCPPQGIVGNTWEFTVR